MTLPRTEQPEYTASQASPWLPINQMARVFDAFCFRTSVIDRDLNDPPASCADGTRYLVASSAVDEWTGQENHIAIAVGTDAANGWYFVDARIAGVKIYVVDEAIEIIWNGAAFVNAASAGQAFTKQVAGSDQVTALTAGTVFEFEWDFACTMQSIHGYVNGAPDSSAELEVDIRLNGASVFTTDKITWDVAERSSRNALVQPNLTTTSFAVGDIVQIVVVSPGDNVTGLVITFSGIKS